jgi:hypothetical protein
LPVFNDPNTGLYSPGADQVAISTNGTGRLFVDASGRIGVNNPSPTTNLDVLSASTTQISVTTTEATGASIAGLTLNQQGAGASSFIVRAGGNYTSLGSTTNTPVLFASNNLERLRITGNGSVGLGASSPGALLHIAEVAAVSGFSSTSFRSTRSNYGADFTGYIDQGVSSGAIISTVEAGTATERVRITNAGRVGIGTAGPTALLDVSTDTVRVRTARTPGSATATGNAGDICWDANYVYVCTATNTWKRSALSTW